MLSTIKAALVVIATTLIGKSFADIRGINQTVFQTGPTCTNVTIPVTVTAENFIIPTTTPPTFQEVSGTFNIAARYCEPQNHVESRHHTLQLLVHGLTYTRNYWSGDGEPGLPFSEGGSFDGNLYSWIDFASAQGYPTLSIDRLGNGLSDHPDPINVLQTPLQIEVTHQIIIKARGGSLPGPANRSFNKIIYAGHSYGSELGNGLNAKYPTDADGTILTGFSSSENQIFIQPAIESLVPASTINPSKFGSLPSGYLTFNNKTIFEELFYYPPFFDPTLFELDFANRGTVGVGELEIMLFENATEYRNPVFVITGQHDAIFCSDPDPVAFIKPFPTFDCGPILSGFVEQTKILYPNADYEFFLPSESGHIVNFHFQAFEAFVVAHLWLQDHGF